MKISLMLSFSKLCLYALLTLIVSGCNFTGPIDQAEYIPVKIDSDGEWGLLGANGEPLFSNEFKNPISNVVDGVFIVKENQAYTIYKASATPAPLGSYENLLSVGKPAEGKIVVCTKDNAIEAISTAGERIFILPEKIIATQAYFRDGLIGVCDNTGKWGFMDDKGAQAIPHKYDGISTFSEGFAVVANIANNKVALSIINKKGETVARVKNSVRLASDNPTFVNGRIPAVNSDDQFGFLTTSGTFEKCSGKVKGIGNVSDNRFIFKNENSKFGAMDYNGNIIVQPRYDELFFVPGSDKYLSKINTTFSLLDGKGEKVKEFSEYSKMSVGVNRFPIIASPGNRFEILDSDGKLLTQETFAEVGESSTAFAIEYIFRTAEIENGLLQTIKESLTNMFNRFDSGNQGSNGMDINSLISGSPTDELQPDTINPEIADPDITDYSSMSVVQEILNSGCIVRDGLKYHFFKGAFYAGNKPFPVMVAFIQSESGIQNAIYKNLTNNVKITMSCTLSGNYIILAGKDGKNPFTINLTVGGPSTLTGEATSGNSHLAVSIKPSSETF